MEEDGMYIMRKPENGILVLLSSFAEDISASSGMERNDESMVRSINMCKVWTHCILLQADEKTRVWSHKVCPCRGERASKRG